jgi:hypothetical protein
VIRWGPYETLCKGIIPPEAITTTLATGDILVIYIPTEKGKLFHAAPQPYVLGEGGRGSAKSTTLRWDAHLRNLIIPGHRALLLRRTFPQLRGSHFAKVGTEGKQLGCNRPFNQSKFFLEYNNGSMLQFGHCESDAAINDYLSQEWDWIGFDELTTFTYDQFIRIGASARIPEWAAATGRKSYIRAATNPIGEGSSWVKRYFIDHSVTEEEAPDYKPSDWRDIKMNLVDNPHMPQEEYKQKLKMLGSDVLRRAYIDGEWLVEGQFFSEFRERDQDNKPWHVLPAPPKIDGRFVWEVDYVQIIRIIYWGFSELEPLYCVWIAMLPNGTAIAFKELILHHHTPPMAAEKIKTASEGMKVRMTYGDPMMWREREGLSISEQFARAGVSMIPANNERENGWVALHAWLMTTVEDDQGKQPRFQLLNLQQETGMGCPYAIRTLPALQTNPKNPRDLLQPTGVEDHAADTLRYWASNRPAPSRIPVKSLDHLPKELRVAMFGYGDGSELLGSESTQR